MKSAILITHGTDTLAWTHAFTGDEQLINYSFDESLRMIKESL
jgi:hypothetical protein